MSLLSRIKLLERLRRRFLAPFVPIVTIDCMGEDSGLPTKPLEIRQHVPPDCDSAQKSQARADEGRTLDPIVLRVKIVLLPEGFQFPRKEAHEE